MVPLLRAYGITRLVSSTSKRCSDTLRPYASAAGLRMRLRDGLSEEGFEEDPSLSARHLSRILERGEPAALCSHGPVLPSLVERLGERVDPAADDGTATAAMLAEAALAKDAMAKGELLVCHMVGTGEEARVVAAERYPT
jgi:8-oxo-(d)GTP phosphatase